MGMAQSGGVGGGGQQAPPPQPQQAPAQGVGADGGPNSSVPSGFNFGFGTSPEISQVGTQAPNRPPGVNIPPPQPGPSQAVRNAFLPAVFTAPYYNAAATAGNLGTMMTAGVAPAAANFMQQQFSPTLNPMEQSFMQAGLSNASRALEQGMLRQESQFEDTPFHSALPRAQGDVMSQVADSLLGQGAQLGLQRQQMANQTAQFPFNYGLQAAQVGPNMSERYYNLLNNAYQQYTNLPLATYSQVPIPSPVVQTNSGSSGGKL